MPRALVVGGNGFIGSHLVDALVDKGFDVSVFDQFSRSEPHWEREGPTILDGNFLNRGDVSEAVKGMDLVVHMLSTTDPATAQKDPTLDLRTNVLASIALFEECVSAGVGHVYYSSSGGAIYGDQDVRLFSEESRTLPISPYAIGKLTIESYLRFFSREYGLRSTTFRISNPYGTRQNPHKRQGIIPIFLRDLLMDRPLTVMGDGSMVRDYIYVNDLAGLLAEMMSVGPRRQVYNVGSGIPTSINDIVRCVVEVTGKNPEIVHVETPTTYVKHVTLDISRLRGEFGDPKTTSLKDGIAKTWEEIREQGI